MADPQPPKLDSDNVVSAGVSTTTGTGWTEKLNLPTFTPSWDGTYLIEWSCEMNCDKSGSLIEMRVMQDDTTEIGLHIHPAGSVNDYTTVSGFVLISLTVAGGPYRFDIDFASPDTDVVRIRRASLVVRRLP